MLGDRCGRMGIAVFAALVAMLAAGCDSGGGGASLPGEGDYIGTWIENPQAIKANPRIASPDKRISDKMRILELSADHTFKLQLGSASGQPDAGKGIEGAWRVEEGALLFEVKANGLGDKYKPWEPVDATLARRSGETLLSATHGPEAGELVLYRKK